MLQDVEGNYIYLKDISPYSFTVKIAPASKLTTKAKQFFFIKSAKLAQMNSDYSTMSELDLTKNMNMHQFEEPEKAAAFASITAVRLLADFTKVIVS